MLTGAIDDGVHLPVAAAVRGAAQRLVVGPRVLQPVVLVLTHGDGQITVRPFSSYAQEGPSVWNMNYLSPIRFAMVPVYRLFPDPRTLIVLQNSSSGG